MSTLICIITKFYLPFLVLSLVFIQINLSNIKTFSGSQIESLNYTCEIPHTYTDWNDVSCELPKFSNTLGELTKVTLTLDAEIRYQWFVENRNAQPRQVGLEVQNTFINLNEQNSANVLLSVNIANQNFSADLEEYDGVDDFNGTSGRSYDDVTLDTADNIIYESLILNSNSFTDILDVAELENYIGDDLIIFPLSTSGDSNCSSSSNISCRIDTTAAAVVSIQYDFIPTEPPVEPPTEPNDPANPNTNPPILTTVRTGGQD